MTILGAGLCAAGTTYAGVGSFTPVSSSAARLFRKSDGTTGNALYTDPNTGDRVLDERGIPRGNDSLVEKVRLAVLTLRDSSAWKSFGLDILTIGTIGPDIKVQVEQSVRLALRHLTSKGKIAIMSITIDQLKTDAIGVLLRWVDLATGKVFNDEIGP